MATEKLQNFIIKYIDVGTVTAGATMEGHWVADDNYVIKHIFIRADGDTPTKSTATLRVDDYVITKDKAYAKTFGNDAMTALLMNIEFKKGSTFYYSIKNEEGASKSFSIELIMEKLS